LVGGIAWHAAPQVIASLLSWRAWITASMK